MPHKFDSKWDARCDTQIVGEAVEPHDLRWYVRTSIRVLSRKAPACILESISNLRTNIAVVACKDCSAYQFTCALNDSPNNIVSMAHASLLLLRCRAGIEEGCDAAFHDRTRFYGLCSLYIFLAGVIVGLLAGTSYAGENTREMKCVGCGYGSVIVCLCSFLPPNRDQERLFFLRDDLQCQ